MPIFNMQQGIPGLGGTLQKGFGYLDAAGNRLAELLGTKNAPIRMGGPNTSRPLTQIKESKINPVTHLGPKPEERAYVEEVSRIAQQPDPYMQNAGMYTPNVEQAYGKPMPERDYADEKEGLMGILERDGDSQPATHGLWQCSGSSSDGRHPAQSIGCC